MKKISIIGTVGVPANYGGFETLVENIIGENCSAELEYTIYCSAKSYRIKSESYKKAKLKYVYLKANGIQSTLYDTYSLLRASFDSDVILILGVSGCSFLPLYRLFSNKKLIVNIDGLEHRREKWGKWAKRFLKFSERMAIKHADIIITDNKGIQDYVKAEYGTDSEMIAYGGDHVLCSVSKDKEVEIYKKHGLSNGEYSFSVCRIEPENNVHLTLEAFSKVGNKKIVFVGNWTNSEYGKKLIEQYGHHSNIQLISPIYDLKELNVLRSNCNFYIHGHSAGGTNPSLVEAMFFEKPILAFDVIYNRETTENKANYFSSVEGLMKLLNNPVEYYSSNGMYMGKVANRLYRWSVIAKQYEKLY